MIITNIELQKKDDTRSSVYIDGEFSFGASNIDILFYKLKVNEEIDEDKLKQILEDLVYSKAREKSFRLLSSKARTEKELFYKLIEKEYSQEVSEKIVLEMKSYKYLDDEVYAKNYLKEKMNFKGEGVNKIKFSLSQKGISKNIIDELFQEYDFYDEQLEKVKELIGIKTRRIDLSEITDKEKQKVYNFLLRRGYTYSVINEAFKQIFEMYID